MLKEHLGDASYKSVIKEALHAAPRATVPTGYTNFWKLRPAGLLNLNLDRIATRAFLEERGVAAIAEFNSRSVAQYTHVLRDPSPFIYNLHGQLDDVASWVFTADDLKGLQQNDAYKMFIQAIALTATIIIVGASADDVAVGGHLEALSRLDIDFGSHYWITPRTDFATDRWAESVGLQVIRYGVIAGGHGELDELFADLISFVPPEPAAAAPVSLKEAPDGDTLLDPSVMAKQDPEVTRLALNSHAVNLLSADTPQAFANYEQFCQDYDRAIYNSWYVTTEAPDNVLLGYTLTRQAAQGAFGTVYEAYSPTGDRVALKLLLNEVRKKSSYLQSFRRGVKSMRILNTRHVTGMVPYHQASEIPAFVVMDWVDGPNLREAVDAAKVNGWWDILRVSVSLAGVIRSAHGLPERVLHRDIRPANVMLQGAWTSDEWKLVVLDFDLSWHRGAYEHSVVHNAGTTGYLAPEQIERVASTSTQHASVDAFAIGMTMYFMVARRDPVPDQHRHTMWEDIVQQACSSIQCKAWHSLPARYARAIIDATRDRQADRLDVSQIEGEASRLLECLTNHEAIRDADLLAEEVAARTDALQGYRWEANRECATSQLASGVRLEIDADKSHRRIHCRLVWHASGNQDRRSLAKYIPRGVEEATAALTNSGWRIDTSSMNRDWVSLIASTSVDDLAVNVERFARGVDKAADSFRYQ